jgi:hypothetical protein
MTNKYPDILPVNAGCVKGQLDFLCNKLDSASIFYDEYTELIECFNNNELNLHGTIERYTRYIQGINTWEIDGICYLYIRNLIIEFLSTYNIHLIKQIDTELIKLLKK